MKKFLQKLTNTMRIKTKLKKKIKKFVLIIKYLENRQFIANKNIISYEFYIGRFFNFKHMRNVEQTNYVQI